MSSIKELYELHKKAYKTSSDSTHISFKTTLNRLAKIYPELKQGDITQLNNPDKTLKDLEEKYKVNSIISTISNIIKLLRIKKTDNNIIDKYQIILTNLMDKKKISLGKQTLSESRQENFVPFNEIQEKLNSTYDEYINENKTFSKYRRYLLLNLFIRNIPVRLGNYINMKIIKKPTKEPKNYNNKNYNYLLVYPNKYIFVFNKYKTAKVYNQKIAKVENDKMKTLINKWLKNYNNTNIFFINNDRNPSTQKNLTTDLKTISKELFNKSFSIDLIRSSYITYLYDTNPNLKTKEKIAKAMAHSVSTAEAHYNKRLEPEIERDELGLPINKE